MTESVARKLAEKFVEVHAIPPFLHGDEKHQAWLKEELQKWIPDLEAEFNEAIRATKEAASAELEKHAEMARHRGLAEIAHTLDVLAVEFRQLPDSEIIKYLSEEVKHG